METLRDRILHRGPSTLEDVELFRAVLGSNGSKTTEETLRFVSVNLWLYRKDFAAFFRRLLGIEGLDEERACAVAAIVELGIRLSGGGAPAIREARDVLPFVFSLAQKPQECFMCLNMDGANRILSNRVITVGLVDQALVHPREVFCEAVKERAVKIIVAHNHPAGILGPSPEDVRITKNLSEASRIIGIALVDHIIVTKEGYFSFREHGLL
ncbi:MAG: DNA repair protein RadC [Spirochaetes bacterium]|nr:DNA repair protein RadC [Spirochaetota bacterium]